MTQTITISEEFKEILATFAEGERLPDLSAGIPDIDLLDSGIIDSLGFMDLLTALENHLKIHIDMEHYDFMTLTRLPILLEAVEAQLPLH